MDIQSPISNLWLAFAQFVAGRLRCRCKMCGHLGETGPTPFLLVEDENR